MKRKIYWNVLTNKYSKLNMLIFINVPLLQSELLGKPNLQVKGEHDKRY